MEAKEIRSQLTALGVHIGATANESAIINCWRVGNHPVMYLYDMVGFAPLSEPERFEGDYAMCALRAGVALRAHKQAKLVMLCDLYAYDNEPPMGFNWSRIEWTREQRIKGAILGLLLVLASFLIIQIINPGLTILSVTCPTP